MSSESRTRFLRRLIGLPAAAPERDAADMGTAIGMEYVLDQPPLSMPVTPPRALATRRRVWPGRRSPT